ncbi:hypothetical protein Tco_1210640 [Tanacetum coccineum]
MTLEHNSLSLDPHCQDNVPIADETVTTSLQELEMLFGPMFDEYFNGATQVVSKSSAPQGQDVLDPVIDICMWACWFVCGLVIGSPLKADNLIGMELLIHAAVDENNGIWYDDRSAASIGLKGKLILFALKLLEEVSTARHNRYQTILVFGSWLSKDLGQNKKFWFKCS